MNRRNSFIEKENILTATDYVNLRKENELLMNYNQDLIKQLKKQKEIIDKIRKEVNKQYTIMGCEVVENWVLLQILEDKEV